MEVLNSKQASVASSTYASVHKGTSPSRSVWKFSLSSIRCTTEESRNPVQGQASERLDTRDAYLFHVWMRSIHAHVFPRRGLPIWQNVFVWRLNLEGRCRLLVVIICYNKLLKWHTWNTSFISSRNQHQYNNAMCSLGKNRTINLLRIEQMFTEVFVCWTFESEIH